MTDIQVLNWNIGNPSLERAKAQLDVITRWNSDILCLTETKQSAGGAFLREGLETRGYHLHFPTPTMGEYGALLASKYPLANRASIGTTGQEARAPIATLPDGTQLIGLYVPSNAQAPDKILRKLEFLRHVEKRLADLQAPQAILLADFNTVATSHTPPVPFLPPEQTKWVDSLLSTWQDALVKDPGPTWISWRGEEYRYDYCLTKGLQTTTGHRIPELRRPGLSDHMGTAFTYQSPMTLQPPHRWRFA